MDMPIKCPVAPLEFCFLADSYFRKRGTRDKVGLWLTLAPAIGTVGRGPGKAGTGLPTGTDPCFPNGPWRL